MDTASTRAHIVRMAMHDPAFAVQDLKSLVDDFERRLIIAALADTGGRQAEAARRLGVKPTTLHEKIGRFGIRPSPGAARTAPLDDTDFCWRGRLAEGCVLEVAGGEGSVLVEAAPDGQVSVEAARRGPRNERAAVSVIESTRGLAVSVVRGAEPRPGLRVDFRVRVPPHVGIVARLTRGDVEVIGPLPRVDARTEDGRVRVSLAAEAASEAADERRAG